MADEATPQVTEETQVAPAEDTAADSATDNQPEEQTSQSPEADASQANADEAKPDANSSDKEQSQDPKPESKPLSRRSAAYRIQQLVEENKALKRQQKPQEPDEWETPQTDEQPDIQKLIDEAVEKRLSPVITESSKAADDSEINELFTGLQVDRTKYEGQIRKLWNLPQYKDVAAQDLFNMLRGKEMDQTIAQAKNDAVEEFKKAGEEAKESSASGTSNANRNTKVEKSAWELSDKEFQDRTNKVRAGG